MSYNGSGQFNINSTGQPVVSGTVISSSTFNALTADLATGLSTAITKDGQTTVTNNIPFNSYKITNLGAGTAATDAARLGQVQGGGATLVTVTGTDTYVGTMSPALASYAAGNLFSFVVPNTNTTGATLNIDGLGAKALTRDGSTALVAGDLVAGNEVLVAYDGTRFQVLNSNSMTNQTISGSLTLSGGTANGVAYLNGSKVLTTGSALTFNGTQLSVSGTFSAVGLAQVNGVSGTSQASITAQAGSGATVGFNRSKLNLVSQAGTNGWSFYNYGDSGDLLSISTYAGLDRLTIAQAGNVTINAPTSGTALAVTGISGQRIANFQGASGSDAYISINAFGSASQWWINNKNGSGNLDFYEASIGATRMTIGYSGNVVINAPTSGVAQTINQATSSAIGLRIASAGSGTDSAILSLFASGTREWQVKAATGGSFVVTDVTRGADVISATSTGNVTINAPNSGAALSVTASLSTAAIQVSSGASNNAGIILQSSGKGAWQMYASGGVDEWRLFNGAADTLKVASAGNVTINAPTSGNSLTINTVAGGAAAAMYAPASQTCSVYLYGNNGGGSLLLQGGNDNNGYITASNSMFLATSGSSRLAIGTTGVVTIYGGTAGTPYLTVNSSATTGAQTATFTATNKPGSGTTAPTKWLPVILDGTTYYIPCWT